MIKNYAQKFNYTIILLVQLLAIKKKYRNVPIIVVTINAADITSDDVMKAIELFQKNNFDSPDILDIMSCIFLKSKDYNNAKKYSEYAIKSLVSNNGYLQKNSEILNNSINVWKYDQDMLNECKKTIPKYI